MNSSLTEHQVVDDLPVKRHTALGVDQELRGLDPTT